MMPIYFIFLFAITVLTGFYVSKRISGEDATRLFSIFLIAYLLRIAIAVVLYKIALMRGGTDGFFYGGDDFAYGNTGWRLADAWRAGNFPTFFEIKRTLSFSKTMGFYQCYLAALMLISKNSTFLPIVINCSFGAASVLVLYAICKKIFTHDTAQNRNISLITAGFLAFWPSAIFWSTQNLKETPAVFFLLVIALTAIKPKRARDFSVLALSLLVLYCLGKSFAGFAAIALALCFIARVINIAPPRVKRVLKMSLFIVVMVIFFGAIFNNMPFLDKMADAVDRERDLRAFGESVIMPNVQFRSFGSFLSFLPVAAVIGFFYPVPGNITSLTSLIASAEMLLWYILVPFFAIGLITFFKDGLFKKAYFIFFFAVVYYLGLGFLEANAGTLFRHKVFVLPFAFIFIAMGIQRLGNRE